MYRLVQHIFHIPLYLPGIVADFFADLILPRLLTTRAEPTRVRSLFAVQT